jgi:hypothetical protein
VAGGPAAAGLMNRTARGRAARQLSRLPDRKRLRRDSRVTVSMMASPSAMSPAAWPVSPGRPNPMDEDTATGWAEFCLPLGARVPGVGLGVADGLILGNRLEALPASMSELETLLAALLRAGMGPSGSVVPGAAAGGGEELADDLVGEAGGAVTATVTAADGGVHFAEVTMLAVAVSRTEVASDPAGICACRLMGALSDTEPAAHAAVPFPLAQPLVTVGFWLDGCAARATDTLVAGPFSVETWTV